MKRIAAVIATVTLIFNSFTAMVFADTFGTGAVEPKKIMLYLKPDVTVEVNGVRQIFKNSKGEIAYPVIYNGSTYLPVRAISAIMKEPIEWDNLSKTVLIGKTISRPNKKYGIVSTNAAISVQEGDYIPPAPKPSMVNADLKPDVCVMYDFVPQTFRDANNDIVYPIIYNGTTYLPIRAVSDLMEEPIVWDGTEKKIYIGDGEEEEPEEPIEEEEPEEDVITAAEIFKDLYEREEALFFEATAKITSLNNAATIEEKQVIAASASDNYKRAQSLTDEIKEIEEEDYTIEEGAVYVKLLSFAESTESYILILENIAYLSVADQDFSMLQETFLFHAMDAQAKMEDAREVIIGK